MEAAFSPFCVIKGGPDIPAVAPAEERRECQMLG